MHMCRKQNLMRIKNAGLKLSVKGLGEVGWCHPSGNHGNMTSYLNDEEYMNIEFNLLEDVGK